MDALLGADPSLRLPAWLTESLLAEDGAAGARVASGVRAYLAHGRLADAAALATALLRRAAQPGAGPAQPGGAYLPHALLRELLARVERAGEGLAVRRAQLLDALAAADRALARQSESMERIFA